MGDAWAVFISLPGGFLFFASTNYFLCTFKMKLLYEKHQLALAMHYIFICVPSIHRMKTRFLVLQSRAQETGIVLFNSAIRLLFLCYTGVTEAIPDEHSI